jgi:hypothetical protein
MGQLYSKFEEFEPGEQQFYISKINKLFSGTYSTSAIEEPMLGKDHQTQGRPKNSKRKHISTSSTKRDPSAFEHVENKEKTRGRPKKVTFEDGMV